MALRTTAAIAVELPQESSAPHNLGGITAWRLEWVLFSATRWGTTSLPSCSWAIPFLASLKLARTYSATLRQPGAKLPAWLSKVPDRGFLAFRRPSTPLWGRLETQPLGRQSAPVIMSLLESDRKPSN